MWNKNEYLPTVPFDIYELHLFHLVASTGSFTRAGQQAGLTQSAITRQIKGVEDRLGLPLFERTTRRVNLTPAGKFLMEQASGILLQMDRSLRRLRQEFQLVQPTVRVGVARTVGLSYLPAIFVSFQKKFPSTPVQVVHESSTDLLAAIEAGDLDVGLLCPPPRLPGGLRVTHRFDDDFTVIAPPRVELPADLMEVDTAGLKRMLAEQRWLLINRASNTGQQLHHWLGKQKLRVEPAMEMDNFDVLVNLVSLGMGCSIVPHRTLPLYVRNRVVRRIRLTSKFSRELVVVIRKNRKPPEHVTRFVENILY